MRRRVLGSLGAWVRWLLGAPERGALALGGCWAWERRHLAGADARLGMQIQNQNRRVFSSCHQSTGEPRTACVPEGGSLEQFLGSTAALRL